MHGNLDHYYSGDTLSSWYEIFSLVVQPLFVENARTYLTKGNSGYSLYIILTTSDWL